MNACPACQSKVPAGGRFCPECGSAVGGEATLPAPRSPSSSAPSGDGGEFAAGVVIADRYRIVGLLGRGGMGEVYRADDLTLGHPVALKFLPPAVAADEDRRQRFFSEVRVARQVAHPNVCRVYDIGEVDGHSFLSMEFIDGEDLSSLLRRIGRLPGEKGVEIARQLCAGLAALHDRGVLHRDLKPANVMIDGRGGVRITDFGLSALVEQAGADVRAGTPAYMAPEQLAGESVDQKSDLYALGLILHEIFTGKRVFEADTLAELSRLHRESTPKSPSTLLPELDPAVERVIGRCLEKDRELRPPSAIAVAAALPGGDPLAAALAAGEIPSLEMVAAAGERGGIRPAIGIACVAAVVAAIVLYGLVNAKRKITFYDPMEKPPTVLVDRAREVLAVLGHTGAFDDSEWGFVTDDRLLSHLQREDESVDRWENLRDTQPPAVHFWYRQSPRQLIPQTPSPYITVEDPPHTVSDMALVNLDTRGRLTGLRIVPPQKDEALAEEVEPDWVGLLGLAGLDVARLESTDPQWNPPSFADRRAAWIGPYPDEPGLEMRFEAAAYRGKPIFFRAVGPWARPTLMEVEEETTRDRVAEIFILGAIVLVLVGGGLLAARNVRLGRGDLKGARRLSLFVLVLSLVRALVTGDHTSDLNAQINLALLGIALHLLAALVLWSFYLALEPYVRRSWPDQIIAWSRVLTGRFRDPLVGRDILVGGVFFLFLTIPDALETLVPQASGEPLPAPRGFVFLWQAFFGVGGMIGTAITCFVDAIFYGMFFLLCILFLRILLRKQKAAMVAFAVVVGAVAFLAAFEGNRILGAGLGVLYGVGFAFVLFRFGLLPFIFGFFLRNLTTRFPLSFETGLWYSGSSIFAIVLILGLTAYGLWIALAGKSVFRDWLSEG